MLKTVATNLRSYIKRYYVYLEAVTCTYTISYKRKVRQINTLGEKD